MKRNWPLIAFGVVLTIVVMYAWSAINKVKEDAANQAAIHSQNMQASEDEKNQAYAQIQSITSRVVSLNDSLTEEQRKAQYWKATVQRLNTTIRTLNAQGRGFTAVGRDSVGQYFLVSFSGKENVTSYAGYTKYYPELDSTKRGFYVVEIRHDTIYFRSSLIHDTDDKWKIVAESLTGGVEVKTTSEIDSSIFIGLRATLNNTLSTTREPGAFGIRLKANLGVETNSAVGQRFNSIFFDGSAEAHYKNFNVTYYPFSNTISAGVFTDFDFSNFSIFKLF